MKSLIAFIPLGSLSCELISGLFISATLLDKLYNLGSLNRLKIGPTKNNNIICLLIKYLFDL